MKSPQHSHRLLLKSVPAVFVVLWATGFIGAKFGLPYAEPMTFLAWRMGLATLLLLAFALLTRAPWPPTPLAAIHVTVAGLLVHGGYLGGVFEAIRHGMPSGLVSLIVGMQPVLTSLAAIALLGERLSLRQWLGLGLGLVGLILVLGHRVALSDLTWTSGGLALFALASISLGTVYQKRFFAGVDLRTGGVLQYAASGLCYAALAWVFETGHVTWSTTFVLALGWSVVGLSLGAVALLYRLLREGAASRVSSLLYLVPPVTALIAYAAFGETLTLPALGGMLLAVLGVALVVA
ncbi:MAG: DMT family transporter [Betaproteobacteria bacterium]|nr:DMT family transporter [Betaproteobacteria bacterium]MDE2131475.1 DMT family transporter [Betaproteobacteria bacterium]